MVNFAGAPVLVEATSNQLGMGSVVTRQERRQIDHEVAELGGRGQQHGAEVVRQVVDCRGEGLWQVLQLEHRHRHERVR